MADTLIRPADPPPNPSPSAEISRRYFTHAGVDVAEFVTIWETAGRKHYKIFWIRAPIDALEIAGKMSPMVHADFPEEGQEAGDYPSLRRLEEAAREDVQRSFEEYWGL